MSGGAFSASASYPAASGLPASLLVVVRRRVVRYSTHDFVTAASDVPSAAPIPGRLLPLSWRSEIATDDLGRFAGASPLGFGQVELANPDRSLDSIFAQSITDGGTIRVLLEQVRADAYGRRRPPALDKFGTVVTAASEQWVSNENTIGLPLRDTTFRLDKPTQPFTYSGAGAIGGTPALAGTTKPMGYGIVRGATPTLIDPGALIYQFNDIPARSVDVVYDRGIRLSPTIDVDDYSDLANTSVEAGSYVTCLKEGVFMLGDKPAGLITCDFHGGAEYRRLSFFTDGSRFTDGSSFASRVSGQYVEDTASIISRLITDRGIGAAPDIESTSFSATARDASEAVGFFLPGGSNENLRASIHRLCVGAGLFFGQAGDGRYECRRLNRATVAWVDVDDRALFDLRRVDLPYRIPPSTWQVACQRNWTPLNRTDVALGATDADVQFVTREASYGIADDPTIATVTPGRTAVVQSFYDSLTDAAAEARRLNALYSLDAGLYEALAPIFAIRYYRGMPIKITYPLERFSVGRIVTIVGMEIDTDAQRVRLTLFG